MWEYQFFYIGNNALQDDADFLCVMNEWGMNGWEPTGITRREGDYGTNYLMKRPKRGDGS